MAVSHLLAGEVGDVGVSHLLAEEVGDVGVSPHPGDGDLAESEPAGGSSVETGRAGLDWWEERIVF